jgi:hypothetical protein
MLCHASDVVPPAATVAGLAVKLTVGAGDPFATATVTDFESEPPGPVHVSTNVVVADSGPTASLSVNSRDPVQPSEAVQVVALLAVHCSIELP